MLKKKGDKDRDKKNDNILCLSVTILEGKDLISCDSNGLSDPYVILKLNGEQTKKTKVKNETLNPVWNEQFHFYSLSLETLELKVMDKDTVGSDFMGTVRIDLSTIPVGSPETLTRDLDGVKSGRISFLLLWKATEEMQYNFDFNKAQKMARLSRAAYLEEADVKARLKEENLVFKYFINLAGSISETQAFMAIDEAKQELIVAFCGTSSLVDVVTDVVLKFSNFPEDVEGSKVHMGFLSAYLVVRDKIKSCLEFISLSNYKLVLTGHSLGGALASIAAIDIKRRNTIIPYVSVYCFGMPRVGNDVYARLFDQVIDESWRVVNKGDIIPRVPACTPFHKYTHHKALVYCGLRNGEKKTVVDPLKGSPEAIKIEKKMWKPLYNNPLACHTVYLDVDFPKSPKMQIYKLKKKGNAENALTLIEYTLLLMIGRDEQPLYQFDLTNRQVALKWIQEADKRPLSLQYFEPWCGDRLVERLKFKVNHNINEFKIIQELYKCDDEDETNELLSSPGSEIIANGTPSTPLRSSPSQAVTSTLPSPATGTPLLTPVQGPQTSPTSSGTTVLLDQTNTVIETENSFGESQIEVISNTSTITTSPSGANTTLTSVSGYSSSTTASNPPAAVTTSSSTPLPASPSTPGTTTSSASALLPPIASLSDEMVKKQEGKRLEIRTVTFQDYEAGDELIEIDLEWNLDLIFKELDDKEERERKYKLVNTLTDSNGTLFQVFGTYMWRDL